MKNRFFNSVGVAISVLALMGSSNLILAQDSPPPPDGSAPPAETLPADVSPDSPLGQVIKLSQSGVDESIITSYINNSTSTFNLSPDQIIYLRDIGVTDTVVKAMLDRDKELGSSTPPPAPATTPATTTVAAPEQPAVVTQNYFYDTLSPYGGWVQVEGYGLCWRPTVVIHDPSWQPYCTSGHWVYSDLGWYWVSDYSWGYWTFHYGRWFNDPRWGWCWWPDTTWGPSWVCWRYSNQYCGWAPLPPRCVYREGVGLFYNGVAVGVGFDFGISVNLFTFVPVERFCDRRPWHYRVGRSHVTEIYNHTTIINNYNVDNNHHTIVNHGIPPQHIRDAAHVDVPRLAVRENDHPGRHGERISGDVIIVNRPRFHGDPSASLHEGVAPRPVRVERPVTTPVRNGPDNRNENRPDNLRTQPGRNETSHPAPARDAGPQSNDSRNNNNVPSRPQNEGTPRNETPVQTSRPQTAPNPGASHEPRQTPQQQDNGNSRVYSPRGHDTQQSTTPRNDSFNAPQRQSPAVIAPRRETPVQTTPRPWQEPQHQTPSVVAPQRDMPVQSQREVPVAPRHETRAPRQDSPVIIQRPAPSQPQPQPQQQPPPPPPQQQQQQQQQNDNSSGQDRRHNKDNGH